jgi:hypothetical protein
LGASPLRGVELSAPIPRTAMSVLRDFRFNPLRDPAANPRSGFAAACKLPDNLLNIPASTKGFYNIFLKVKLHPSQIAAVCRRSVEMLPLPIFSHIPFIRKVWFNTPPLAAVRFDNNNDKMVVNPTVK